MIATPELVGLSYRARPAPTSKPRRSAATQEWWSERQEFWEEYFDPERFPAISAVWDAGGYEEGLDSFEFGLQRILDGIEALLAGR